MSSDFVIPESFGRTGGFGARAGVGRRWFNILTRDADLKPGDAVLDVGCGLGRIAVPLIGYLTGRYEGFDIDTAAVGWCAENITPRAPNFRFKSVELRNSRYNPDATAAAETFEFPYESAAFDVVFLASVFTHLLTPTVTNYVREIHRVLKPGGRSVVSCFLLNEESERAIAARTVRERHLFRHAVGGCLVWKVNMPEASVAHYEKSIRALYRETGFTALDIRYGKWAGRPDAASNQDLVIAVKP